MSVAFQDGQEAEAQELLGLVYVRLAGAIMACDTGSELFETLCREFPDIGRRDTFFGITIAWTQMHADLIISVAEARLLRRELAGRCAE